MKVIVHFDHVAWRYGDQRIPDELLDDVRRGVPHECSTATVLCLLNAGIAVYDPVDGLEIDTRLWATGTGYDPTMETTEDRARQIRAYARRHRHELDPNDRCVRWNAVLADSFWRDEPRAAAPRPVPVEVVQSATLFGPADEPF